MTPQAGVNRIFSYGEVGVDNIIRVPHLPSPEIAAFPTEDSYHIGGAAANFAVLLAAWGVRVGLGGNAIGQDDLGKELAGWLLRYPALDVSRLAVLPGVRTPFCRILVTPDGERSILVYGYPQTPKLPLNEEALAGCQFLAVDLYGGRERLEAARLAKSLGVRTVLNDVIEENHPVLQASDLVVNSAAFVRSQFPGVDVAAHARRLHAECGAVLITTDGANLVHTIEADGSEFWITPPQVPVVDATGAGDAFRAGLVYGLLQDWSLRDAVRWGIAASAIKVGRVGAASQPASLDEVGAYVSLLGG